MRGSGGADSRPPSEQQTPDGISGPGYSALEPADLNVKSDYEWEDWWYAYSESRASSYSWASVGTPPGITLPTSCVSREGFSTIVTPCAHVPNAKLVLPQLYDGLRLFQKWSSPITTLAPITLEVCTSAALRHVDFVHRGRIPPHHTLCLYVDGGTADKDDRASWAVAVFVITEQEHWIYVGFHTGLVDTDADSSHFLGATASTSGAAELSAQAWAMSLALEHIGNFSVDKVCVRFDSTYAASITQALSHANCHPTLAAIAATLKIVVEMKVPLTFEHVAAHTGEPWNELVDAVAKAALDAPSIRAVRAPPACSWASLSVDTIRMLYLLFVPEHIAFAYPTVINGNTLLADTLSGNWIALPPEDIERTLFPPSLQVNDDHRQSQPAPVAVPPVGDGPLDEEHKDHNKCSPANSPEMPSLRLAS